MDFGALEAPPQATARPLCQLHTAHDGFLTVHGPDFRLVRAVRGEDLVSGLLGDLGGLDVDAYVSVNGFYRPRRKADCVCWITANFVDLDYYRVGLSYGQAVGQVLDSERAGRVPAPSMIYDPGRGIWLFWFLRDGDGPVRAWPENVRLWRRIQRAIGRELAPAGADFRALDACRVTRIPGSLNSKTNRRVRYLIPADDQGRPIAYGLEAMAAAVDLPEEACRLPGPATGSTPARRRGQRALHAARLRQFHGLRALRGGFRRAHRYHAVLLYAHILGKLGFRPPAIRRAVLGLGRECRDVASVRPHPLARDECLKAARSRHGFARIRDRTISEWLALTEAESEALRRDFGERAWPVAGSEDGPVRRPLVSREERPMERRAAIRTLVRFRGGRLPRIAETASSLRSMGIPASVGTVHGDYETLGLRSPA